MTTHARAHRSLLAQVEAAQRHVLATVEGLTTGGLERVVVPSGWSMTAMLTHLTYDVEIFWIHAILVGESTGIERVRDGWATRDAPAEAVSRYREAAAHSCDLVAAADLDAEPAWWPPSQVFPFPPFADGWACVHRLLSETTTHAGHLDVVRELIDGRQHLVV